MNTATTKRNTQRELTSKEKEKLVKAVSKTVKQYKVTLNLLAKT